MELIARPSRSAVPVPNQGDKILQNAINSFRQVLTPEQLAEFNNIQSLPDTDAVLVFTAELDLRRQRQKGKSIASRLAPVLQAVHSFTSVIDTCVSSNPIIAALVWGSVKMTIQIILNAASYYEAFAELFMNLSTVCPRFEQYQALFPTSTRLQVALCNFNASIIRCCQRVIQMPKSSSGWTSPLNPLSSSFWQSFQQSFESHLQELRGYSKSVKEEIKLAQAESEHRNRELQKLENGEAEKSRRSLSRFMSRTSTRFDAMHQAQLVRNEELEREKKQKLLDSLSSCDYMKPLKQARQKRYPQSASWIFDTNEFKSWAEGNTSPLLWCSGKMGSGKTILAANVIDFFLTEKPEHKHTVTFFFSRFDESDSLRVETALRAIVRQIISIQDISGDTKVALGDIQKTTEDVLGKLTQLLRSLLVQKRRSTWIVIDGIDEWPRNERRKLIGALSSVVAGDPDTKVFATSRDSPDSMTKKAFSSLNQISMNCSLAQQGMAQLVNQAVQKCLDAEELLVNDRTLIDDIERTLTENADGMILWVTLVLRDLCMQPNNERIRDAIALKNLPKSLSDIFNRALERIISQGKEEITRAILPWIVAAKQPLSLSQLEECCLIHVLQEHSKKDRYVNGIQLVDSWFQGLVEIDHETKTVHFIHSSVQQFFLKTPVNSGSNVAYISMEDSDRYIGEIIVTYLNFNDFKKTLTRQRQALPPISPEGIYQQALSNELGWRNLLLRGHGTRTADIDGTILTCTRPFHATFQDTMDMKYPFLSYASRYWLSHSSNFNPKHCQVWHVWKDMLLNGHELTTSPVSEGYHQIIDLALIHWAMSTGHYPFLYLVATSEDLLNQFHTSMFHYVVDENNVELLSVMVKTKTWGSELRSPCCRAARCGLFEVLKVLVEAGVHPNDRDGSAFELPLIEAIEAGKVDAVELLLASGANPNLSASSSIGALERAVRLDGSKGIQVCKMLIKAGADLDHVSSGGSTALQKACKTGQEKIVTLLLNTGANPNADNRMVTYSSLEMAIAHEHIQIIRLLLEFGANVNPNHDTERSPLGIACCSINPRVDIVELLFKAGAKMNEKQSYFLLQEAVKVKSAELVKLLIKEGASVSCQLYQDDDDTPLKLAANNGLFEIMHIILDTGVLVLDVEHLLSEIPRDLQKSEGYEEVSRTLYGSRGQH